MSAMPNTIPIPMPGGFDIDLPRFMKVRQKFSSTHIEDVEAAVSASFAKLPPVEPEGKAGCYRRRQPRHRATAARSQSRGVRAVSRWSGAFCGALNG